MGRLRFFPIFGFLAFAVCAGCDTSSLKTCTVEGTVTFDGKPLGKAFVVFHPKNAAGIGASGFTDENGNYSLTSLQGGKPGKGAVAADYLVTIARDKDEPSTYREERTPGGLERVPIYESLIPARYNTPQNSGFAVSVVQGKNKFDFALEK